MRKLDLSIIPIAFKAKWSRYLSADIAYSNMNEDLVILKFNEQMIERVPVYWVYFELTFDTWVGKFAHNGKLISTTPKVKS